jgi:hypothetical protein
MIKPTVGRIVWFFSSKPSDESTHPLAAIVTAVLNDRCVNLAIFWANGVPMTFPPTRVTLLQEGDEVPEAGPYCTWMPYQIGQASRKTLFLSVDSFFCSAFGSGSTEKTLNSEHDE